MKVRSARLIGIALASALTLVASAAAAETPLKLLVWINGDKGYKGLQQVGDRFKAASGVDVVVQHPEGAPAKFQQAAGAGKGPDVFCWPHDRVGEWAQSGLISPVSPPRKLRKEIEESAWQAFTWRGKVWGYPLAIEAVGLIWNKALIKAPPASFEEVMQLDKTLAAKGKKAILWDYRKSFFTWPMMAGAGGYIYGADGRGGLNINDIGVNNAGAVRATTFLNDMVKAGVLPRGAGYAEMESAFNRGEVAMMISGPWAWDNLKRTGIDFGVAPIPSVGGTQAQPFVGVLGCMIVAPSKVKDLAREFIEQYVLSIDGLKTINADVPLGTPANKALFAELSADPHIRATMENARRGAPVPNIPEVGRFWTALDAALEAVTNGQQSPQEALDGAAARMRAR